MNDIDSSQCQLLVERGNQDEPTQDKEHVQLHDLSSDNISITLLGAATATLHDDLRDQTPSTEQLVNDVQAIEQMDQVIIEADQKLQISDIVLSVNEHSSDGHDISMGQQGSEIILDPGNNIIHLQHTYQKTHAYQHDSAGYENHDEINNESLSPYSSPTHSTNGHNEINNESLSPYSSPTHSTNGHDEINNESLSPYSSPTHSTNGHAKHSICSEPYQPLSGESQPENGRTTHYYRKRNLKPQHKGSHDSSSSQQTHSSELDLQYEDESFRKRFSRACFTFLYFLLASIAVVVTYSMVQDLITSMNNPVRSIHYKKVTNYEAPGIAVYPGGAKFLACGHYYNNVVTSKVSLTQLDLQNHTCNFTNLKYTDPHYPDLERDVTIMRGPTSFTRREAIFLHFELEDELRDFFTVSYFVFPGYDNFQQQNRSEQGRQIVELHRFMPTFALSAGLRMWIKLIMSESHLMDGTKHTDFRVEYSVVQFHDRRPSNETNHHLFFIFFEWKNDIIEKSYLIYTTTPWSIGAGLCGVFLTLHRGYQLSQTSYKRLQKDKERRNIRKQTLREMRASR